MANKSSEPREPKPLAVTPDKAGARPNPRSDSLEFRFYVAGVMALLDAMATKGVPIPNKGEMWVDCDDEFNAFFPEWQKVERDRRAAKSKFHEVWRQMLDNGDAELTTANGRTHRRLREMRP